MANCNLEFFLASIIFVLMFFVASSLEVEQRHEKYGF